MPGRIRDEGAAQPRRTRDARARSIWHANLSNLFWGSVLSLGSLAASVFLLNRSALDWSDPLSPLDLVLGGGVLFVVSVGTFLWLVRPHVRVQDLRFVVRNPLTVRTVGIAEIEAFEVGFYNYPVIVVRGRRIYVWGMQKQLPEGLLNLALSVELVDVPLGSRPEDLRARGARGLEVRRDVLDAWLITLLVAWAAYALSFAF